MTTTRSLHQMCAALFDAYPLAVDDDEMVLTTPEVEFYILDNSAGSYVLRPWRTGAAVEINDETWDAPAWVTGVLTHAVPLPRDTSLFGWKPGNQVTALMAIYTQYSPKYPEPVFMVMPRAGLPETERAPFTADNFGRWFWDHYQRGRIVNLADVIVRTRSTVFWVPGQLPSGNGCVAVWRDVVSPDGWTLPRGAYAWHGDLGAVPPLGELLAAPGKIDLGPSFETF